MDEGHPVTVLGDGTNVLISEAGIKGLVICMKNLVGVEEEVSESHVRVICMAGTAKAQVLRCFLKNKLQSALFLAGLPGDVGGGVVMNAGVSEGYVPREFEEITDWIEVVTIESSPQVKKYTHDEIQWSYRQSKGWQPGVIVRAQLSWPNKPDDEVMKSIRLATRNRLMKQPLDKPSCGSTFVNPPGDKAGRLIEAAGLKGFRQGNAYVSDKHANFIITEEGATANDVLAIIRHVQQTVQQKFAIELQTEIQFLG